MIDSNYQCIRELDQKIEDKSLRCEIVFFDTLIGSYEARKQNPDKFIRQRQITGQILEAEYIAKQRRNTLELLKKNSVIEVHKKLSMKLKPILKNGTVKQEGIYDYSLRFTKSRVLRLTAGKRLETRLKNSKEIITEELTERQIRKIFLTEYGKMSGGLVNEIKKYEQI